MNIIVTKKLESLEKQKLINEKFTVFDVDFIKIQLKNFTINASKEYLIFTSQNAVKSVLKNQKATTLKSVKCFCVGEKTKELLQQNNFHVIAYFDYAEELAKEITEKHQHASFMFFCGNLRRDTLPNAMKSAKINFEEVLVYETKLAPTKLKEIEYKGILFFSPSGVSSFLKENTITNQTCFCIGTTTAKALVNTTKNIQIASKPTINSVIDEVIKYYK